jgi:hypothetical protein
MTGNQRARVRFADFMDSKIEPQRPRDGQTDSGRRPGMALLQFSASEAVVVDSFR